MEQVLVSVRCAAFNHEKYIRQALDSFLMQRTDFPFEIVVNDDASTDATVEILKEYEKKYPDQIRLLLHDENQYSQGKSPAVFLNPALRGTYVALCEGDDYWTDPEKLQRQVDFLRSHPQYSLVAHQAQRVDEAGTYVRPYAADPNREDYDMDFSQVVEDLSRFPTASMLLRRDFFDRYQENLNEIGHFDYIYKLLLAGTGKVRVLARSMSAYRMSASGSWTERMDQDVTKYIAHLQKSIRAFGQVDRLLEGRYCEILGREIHRRTAQLYECSGDLKSLRQKEFRKDYRAIPVKSKLSLWLRWYFPGLYARLKGKN